MVREVLDLAADPERAVAREGTGQGALDLLVEAPNREDVGMSVAMELRVEPRRPAGLLLGVGPRPALNWAFCTRAALAGCRRSGRPASARRSTSATRACRRSETAARFELILHRGFEVGPGFDLTCALA